jgi:nitrite reductase/ring-hydroxylating ferredoxin subunit
VTEWHKVARVADVEEGKPLGVVVGDQLIALFRVADSYHAVSNVCTHEVALLSDGYQEGSTIECPLHQARFDVTNGKCLGPPAETDLVAYQLKIEDGEIWVRA